MKVSKQQIRRIIKEEKAKLLVEMNPVANAERSLGMYANTVVVDQLNKTVARLLEDITAEAVEDGLEEDESYDMAVDAVVMAVSEAFLSAGMVDQAQAVIYMLSRR